MERSGLAYQTLGEPERSLLEERRGDVEDEDMTVDVLMGQERHIPFLLIRLDTSNPRDSPVPSPIGPQFNYNNPLPWINLL
jgi:hypothetical protein